MLEKIALVLLGALLSLLGTFGTITAFINKFTNQSYVTDNQGHPV